MVIDDYWAAHDILSEWVSVLNEHISSPLACIESPSISSGDFPANFPSYILQCHLLRTCLTHIMQHFVLSSHTCRQLCVAAPYGSGEFGGTDIGVLLNIAPRTLRWATCWNGSHIGRPTPPARDSNAGAEGSNWINILENKASNFAYQIIIS